ncbi:MAG TPA: ABC transporter permease [Anaerolineaceae bacterium]|nr:ABC transporter permease [Anaerolineaceae bacterium]
MTTTEKIVSTMISAKPPRKSFFSRFLHWEWFLVVLIVLVVAINSRLSTHFLDVRNLFTASSDFMEMGLMMLPMVFIIITGNVDLAVASTLGMTASFMGLLFNQGINIWLAAGLALVLGLAAGFVNGYLISRLKVPALVITLGTYAFYRGMAYVMLGDQAARGYPSSFTYIGQGKIPGTLVPFSVVLFLVLAVAFGLVLHKTAFGRYLYAIGNNQDAVVYSGISVARIKVIIFLVSGLMSALAGLVLAARFGSTRPDIGSGLELAVITATVLGGVDINGGRGSMIGAVLALILVGLMRFGMGLLNIQGQVQSIAIGILLILSILLPNLPQIIREGRTRWTPRTALVVLLGLLLAIAFGWFFFWSRAVVFSIS